LTHDCGKIILTANNNFVHASESRYLMSDNPFQSPKDYPGQQGGEPPQYPSNPLGQLKAPAIILIILAVISILNILSGIVIRYSMGELRAGNELIFSMVVAFGLSAVQLAILMGAVNMLKGNGYSSARMSGILSCIPVCTPCFLLGIPFGIWALVVLGKQEVKDAFNS